MAKKVLVPRPKSHSPIVTLQQKLNPISAQLYIARPNTYHIGINMHIKLWSTTNAVYSPYLAACTYLSYTLFVKVL